VVLLYNKFSGSMGFRYVEISRMGGNSTIIINSAKTQSANLAVIDASGRIILNTSITLQNGVNTIFKTLPAIANGLYYVKIVSAEETIVKSSIAQ
ncbi:MAG TPA: T9SS type A sorting domain-containing protein, partial [Ferruginibacter sp.]|nr:T9SS type A sorting domain-containing protein [Ferruginibacter sp.]